MLTVSLEVLGVTISLSVAKHKTWKVHLRQETHCRCGTDELCECLHSQAPQRLLHLVCYYVNFHAPTWTTRAQRVGATPLFFAWLRWSSQPARANPGKQRAQQATRRVATQGAICYMVCVVSRMNTSCLCTRQSQHLGVISHATPRIPAFTSFSTFCERQCNMVSMSCSVTCNSRTTSGKSRRGVVACAKKKSAI